MSNTSDDLERRLRSAAGDTPDANVALVDVMARIGRRRKRRAGMAVAAVLAVLLIGTGWFVVRPQSEESSVYVGEPTTSLTEPPPADAISLDEQWSDLQVRVGSVGHSGNGRFTVVSNDSVFVAGDAPVVVDDQNSTAQTGPRGRVTALDRDTGSERWVADFDAPTFLQGVAGSTLIVNTQYDHIFGLNVADGSISWEVSLPELGLNVYGAVVSAIGETVTVIGLAAEAEGDTRAPVLLGVAPTTGEVMWNQVLVEGTDLNWGAPQVDGGQAVFLSTLSHPGSAAENVAHLVSVADGTVLWSAGLGGSQLYNYFPGIIDGDLVYLPGPTDVLAVERADGTRRFASPGHAAAPTDAGMWLIRGEAPDASDRSLVLVDPTTGDLIRSVESPIAGPEQLVDLGDQRLGVVSRSEIAIIDTAGTVLARAAWRGRLIEPVLFDDGQIIGATEALQGVAVLSIGP